MLYVYKPLVALRKVGNPQAGDYAIEAQTNVANVSHVEFSVDGKLRHTRGTPKYCLFPGENPCNSSRLGGGQHTIEARAYDSPKSPAIATTTMTVIEGYRNWRQGERQYFIFILNAVEAGFGQDAGGLSVGEPPVLFSSVGRPGLARYRTSIGADRRETSVSRVCAIGKRETRMAKEKKLRDRIDKIMEIIG